MFKTFLLWQHFVVKGLLPLCCLLLGRPYSFSWLYTLKILERTFFPWFSIMPNWMKPQHSHCFHYKQLLKFCFFKIQSPCDTSYLDYLKFLQCWCDWIRWETSFCILYADSRCHYYKMFTQWKEKETKTEKTEVQDHNTTLRKNWTKWKTTETQQPP